MFNEAFLQQALEQRRLTGSLRSLQTNPGLVDFCSNDYLGLARSEKLLNEAEQEWERLREKGGNLLGSGGSRLLSGNTDYAEELEREIATFHQAEAALIFNSGYDANLGFFSCVPRRGDTVLYDELIHASVRDGIRLSHAQAFSFGHNDLARLEERLQKAKGKIFVAVESVYSMDGDACPLEELVALCENYGALLTVDEAHAVGLLGEKGAGAVSAAGLQDRVFARLCTFGKALGCHGAAIVGSAALREYLVNFARSFIYTTALPLHSLAAIRCAYRFSAAQDEARAQLRAQVKIFREPLLAAGFEMTNAEGPIQCLLRSGNEAVRHLAATIRERGFDVRAILSPTVPAGKERIRVCLHAFNTPTEIKDLVENLRSL